MNMHFARQPKKLGQLLSELMTCDFDAISAYEAAISRVQSPPVRDQLQNFVADHQRHVMDLRPHANRCDHAIVRGPDASHYLTTGKVMVAQMLGDKAVLASLTKTSDEALGAYGHALSCDRTPPELLAVLQRNYLDEKRHRNWLEHTLHPEHRDDYGEQWQEAPVPFDPRGWQAGLDIPPPL